MLSSILLLLSAGVRSQRGRLLAAAIAISFAATMLLAALIGKQALIQNALHGKDTLLQENELHLAATDAIHPFLDPNLLDELRRDPRVAQIAQGVIVRAVELPGTESGMFDREKFYSTNLGGSGGWIPGRRDGYLAWNDAPRGRLVAGRWPSPDATDPIEIAVAQKYTLGHKLDAWRLLESDTGVHRARIVGLFDSGEMPSFSVPEARLMTRQINSAAAQLLAGGERPPSDARIVLKNSADRGLFQAEWKERLAAPPGHLELWDSAALRAAILQTPAASSAQTALLTAIVLAGTCVVCIALGVQGSAVRERAAQLTLLRSLGATRPILAGVVLGEAALVSLLGLLGSLLLTWGLLQGLGAYLPFLKIPAAPDAWSILITGLIILAGSLIGSLWPAYLASRASPTEVAADTVDPERAARFAKVTAWLAILIGSVGAGLVLMTNSGTMQRAGVEAWVGLPVVGLAAVLLTPLSIRLVNRALLYPVAWLTRTNSLVLGDQIAGDGPRMTGAVISVAVGLGSFLWVLCWGASMLDSFVIDQRLPRWLASIHPYGLDQAETEQVLAAKELRGFQPLTLFDTRLATPPASTESVPTLVMGVDSQRAFEGSTALPFQFIAGERRQAIAELKEGQCLVSDWYAASEKLKVGDSLAVAVPGPEKPRDQHYRIAGIVELRGWRMMTKLNKVRLRGEKHRVMVVLAAETVRRDFPVAYANYFLGNPAPDAAGTIPGFRRDVPVNEAHAQASTARQEVESSFRAAVDLQRPIEFQPDGGPRVRTPVRTVQVDDLDRTRFELLGNWGGGSAQRMGWLPLLVLAISLLSVSGAVAASMRAHGYELGVLRSCGLTRFGLLRLALAESLMIGLAAIPVAAFLGAGVAWIMLDVTSLVGYRLDFAGIRPDFVVPWAWFLPGGLLTLIVCGLAALWGGWRVSRTAPSVLLSGSTKTS